MSNFMSRIERLWAKLEEVAGEGKWSYQTTLYSSEIRRIENQWGVNVQRLKTEGKYVTCLISWSNAFYCGMNYKQSWYISRLQDDVPQVDTPAQKLFLISARA